MTLKLKLILAFSMLFLSFSVATSFVTLRIFGDAYRKNVIRELSLLANNIGEGIDSRLGVSQTALAEAAAHCPEAAVTDPMAAQRYLSERFTLQQFFPSQLLLVDRQGRVVARHPSRTADNPDLARYDAFFLETLAANAPRIAEPTSEPRVSNRFELMLATPVHDRTGAAIGLLVGNLDLLAQTFRLSHLATQGIGEPELYLLQRDGRFIHFRHAPGGTGHLHTGKMDPDSDPLLAAAFASGSLTGESRDRHGVPVVASYLLLPRTDWLVAVFQPQEQVYAPLFQARRYYLLANCVGTAAVLLLAFLFARELIAPLTAMARHVQALPGLRSEQRQLHLERNDEIGDLGRAFDDMAAITEAQKLSLEAAVLQAETEKAKAEAILAALGDGLSIQDRDFRVLYQNEVHKSLTGDRRGEPCYQAYAKCDEVCSGCPVALAFADGGVHRLEKTSSGPEGPLVVELSASVLRDSSGHIVAGLELVRDITERKAAEDRILLLNRELQNQTEDLAAANQDLKSFNYSLSHDLRTPLSAVYTASELLTEEYAGQLDERGRFLVEAIVKGSERIDELISAMLLLSRIAQSDLERSGVDLGMLGRDILQGLAAAEPERPVDWKINGELLVEGDPALLRILLANLLGNAWKYTRLQERACIELDSLERNGEKVFFVRDNGAGFAMEQAHLLFQPFKRLHSEAEFRGIGIGLATVQRIVQRHNGRIWAESAPGSGATFYFTLPSVSTPPSEAS